MKSKVMAVCCVCSFPLLANAQLSGGYEPVTKAPSVVNPTNAQIALYLFKNPLGRKPRWIHGRPPTRQERLDAHSRYKRWMRNHPNSVFPDSYVADISYLNTDGKVVKIYYWTDAINSASPIGSPGIDGRVGYNSGSWKSGGFATQTLEGIGNGNYFPVLPSSYLQSSPYYNWETSPESGRYGVADLRTDVPPPALNTTVTLPLTLTFSDPGVGKAQDIFFHVELLDANGQLLGNVSKIISVHGYKFKPGKVVPPAEQQSSLRRVRLRKRR